MPPGMQGLIECGEQKDKSLFTRPFLPADVGGEGSGYARLEAKVVMLVYALGLDSQVSRVSF